MKNKIYKINFSDAVYYKINNKDILELISNKNNTDENLMHLYFEKLDDITYKELITQSNVICKNIEELNNINLGFIKLYNTSITEIKHYNFISDLKNMQINSKLNEYKEYIINLLIHSQKTYQKLLTENLNINNNSRKYVNKELNNMYETKLYSIKKVCEMIKLLKK